MHENTTFCLIKNLRILHKSFFLDSNLRGLVRGLRGDSVYGYVQTKLRILLLFYRKLALWARVSRSRGTASNILIHKNPRNSTRLWSACATRYCSGMSQSATVEEGFGCIEASPRSRLIVGTEGFAGLPDSRFFPRSTSSKESLLFPL